MKNPIILVIFVVLFTQMNSQTPYNPDTIYNFTYIDNYPYNLSQFYLCSVPSADGTYCEKCSNDLLRVENQGPGKWSNCKLQFPLDPCYAFDYNNFNCILCHDGYWLNQTQNDVNFCIPKTRGCLNYDPINKKCITCMDGWVMNTTVNKWSLLTEYYCMFSPDKNCLSYDTNDVCLSCATNYQLISNKCIYVIPNCEISNGNVCSKCKTNYQLDVNGNCIPIPLIQNCQLQIDYTCQSCVTGYNLESNKCVYVISNCAKVNGMSCTQCNSGFYVTPDGKCAQIPKIAYCMVQSEFVCTKCNSGFYFTQEGKCNIIPRIQNCMIQSDFSCTQCNQGFYLISDGKCAQIPRINNCQIQSDFTCTQCTTGYSLVENTCIVVIPNCMEVSGVICSKCAEGYTINSSGHCQYIPRILVQISNCDVQIQNTCTKCVSGYNLQANSCVYYIENCKKVSGTICQECADGYVLNSDKKCIFFDPFVNYDPNCRLYDNAVFNKCLQCSGGFFINSIGRCQQVDPLCKTYNSKNGYCLTCFVGYSLDSINGKCMKALVASQFFSNSENCYQYDFAQSICIKCAEGFYFNNAKKCQKFYDSHCKTPSADKKYCTQCYNGYTYDAVQGKCIIGNFNCATWKNGKCETCPKGYYLDSNMNCILVDQYCKIFNPISKTCLFCYAGYMLDSDKKCKSFNLLSISVQKYSANCSNFNLKGQCIECFYGYYIAQDTTGFYCKKVSDLCKGYNKTTGKCNSCYLGYYLTLQGECQRFY